MKADCAAPLVLMYHRIAEPASDPWRLSVTPENFSKQLDLLATEFTIIPAASRGEQHHGRTISITFDDGYADNLHAAQPILAEHSASATVFVTAGYIGRNREFWWDELERLILLPGTLPKLLDLESCGIDFRFRLGEMATYTDGAADAHASWRVTYDGREPPTERHRLFLSLWQFLSGCNEVRRRSALDFLNAWASTETIIRDSHRPLNEGELIDLHERGGIEIGSHCMTHSPLPTLDPESKRAELESSRSKLESILGHDVTSLAYPHGEYDLETLKLAEETGYRFAYGTKKPQLTNQRDDYQIPRTMVMNWSVRKFARRIDRAFAKRQQVLRHAGS
jgi:peptidoglycan/xylan/chitin deacetylase (PgdA/CDA1 family)